MSDKFLLVRSSIRVTEYMQDGHREAIEQDLVIAQNEDQAQEKLWRITVPRQ